MKIPLRSLAVLALGWVLGWPLAATSAPSTNELVQAYNSLSTRAPQQVVTQALHTPGWNQRNLCEVPWDFFALPQANPSPTPFSASPSRLLIGSDLTQPSIMILLIGRFFATAADPSLEISHVLQLELPFRSNHAFLHAAFGELLQQAPIQLIGQSLVKHYLNHLYQRDPGIQSLTAQDYQAALEATHRILEPLSQHRLLRQSGITEFKLEPGLMMRAKYSRHSPLWLLHSRDTMEQTAPTPTILIPQPEFASCSRSFFGLTKTQNPAPMPALTDLPAGLLPLLRPQEAQQKYRALAAASKFKHDVFMKLFDQSSLSAILSRFEDSTFLNPRQYANIINQLKHNYITKHSMQTIRNISLISLKELNRRLGTYSSWETRTANLQNLNFIRQIHGFIAQPSAKDIWLIASNKFEDSNWSLDLNDLIQSFKIHYDGKIQSDLLLQVSVGEPQLPTELKLGMPAAQRLINYFNSNSLALAHRYAIRRKPMELGDIQVSEDKALLLFASQIQLEDKQNQGKVYPLKAKQNSLTELKQLTLLQSLVNATQLIDHHYHNHPLIRSIASIPLTKGDPSNVIDPSLPKVDLNLNDPIDTNLELPLHIPEISRLLQAIDNNRNQNMVIHLPNLQLRVP